MTSAGPLVRLLASVTDESEASLAVSLGADLVDAKNPSDGALGALPHDRVAGIVGAVAGRCAVSATIGDLVCSPDAVAAAVAAMASTGVDIVKIGLFPGADVAATIDRVGRLQLDGCRLVGVILADRSLDLELIGHMARAGFLAAMLDTADKSAGPLPDVVETARLAQFVAETRQAGLLAGLAGALRVHHVPAMLRLQPDIIGFRGALCVGAERVGRLDRRAFGEVRAAIPGAAAGAGQAGSLEERTAQAS